jgi:hypothetical protein
MIADQTASSTQTSFMPRGLPSVIASDRLSAIGFALHRVGEACRGWAKAPVLPYAELWEASVILRLTSDRDENPPDRYATETPFMTDLWPRG